MTHGEPRGRLSARIEPFWLNPATIKGSIAIGSGLLVLAAPDVSALLLRATVGIALIASGVSDLWFGLRRGTPGRVRAIVEGVLAASFGVVVIVFPTQTLRGLALFATGYLAIRGLSVIGSAISLRTSGGARVLHVVRGLLFVAVALLMLLLPGPFIETVVGGGARAGRAHAPGSAVSGWA
jgi:uncharacterized membrane protein HdeD (DUF308 family)